MATIKISDLHPSGADLFLDSENYLNELTDEELDLTQGGWVFTLQVGSVVLTIGNTAVQQQPVSDIIDHIAVSDTVGLVP